MKVDHNIPLPPRTYGRGKRYPWKTLGVGDSFLAPKESAASVRQLATRWGKKLEYQFVTRKVPGGIRVWRTK